MANHRTIDHVEQIYVNLTRQVNLALAQIVPNQSITKDRLRQLNQLLKAQLESFEASAFPEEQELSHNVYSDTTSCNLYTSKLHALDLANNCSLQVPPQSQGQLRRPQSALFNHSGSRGGRKHDVANHSRQRVTTGVADFHFIETEQNVRKANGIKTISSGSLNSRSVPCSNVIIHIIHEIAPISPSKEQEVHQEHNGSPPVDSEQNQNYKSDTNTRPDTGKENEPRSERSADADTRPNPDTRPDPDKRPDPDTGPEADANSGPETINEGLGDKPADATCSLSATADESPVASKSPLNDDSHRVDEIPPRKRMKLRSKTHAELAYSEASNGDASDGESATSVVVCQRKRKKKAPKRKSEKHSPFEIAQMFGNVKLSSGLDLHLADHRQSLSISPRQQRSRTMRSIGPQQFLHGLSMYRREVENSSLGEQVYRLRYRITLAHFADDYEMAQANSQLFLQWTEHVALKSTPSTPQSKSRRGSKSFVIDRIIHICFPEVYKSDTGESENGADLPVDPEAARKQAEARKRAAHTIQDWLRLGNPWLQFIQEFGYGVLRLVPSEFSDEYLRIMKKSQLMEFLDNLKAERPTFDEPLAQANASMAQYMSWPRSRFGNAMSGVVTSSEPQSLNTGHATPSSSFTTTSVAHTTPVDQTGSRRSLSVDHNVSSDVTQIIDATKTSNHEQPSVEIFSNLPDMDMAANKDVCDGTSEIIRTTEIVMSEAVRAESGPASVPHFFKDAAYGVLPSPSIASGDER